MADDLNLRLRFAAVGIPKTVGDVQKITATVAAISERNKQAAAVAGILGEQYGLATDEVKQLTTELAAAEAEAEALAAQTQEIGVGALGDFASGVKDFFAGAALEAADSNRIIGGLEERLESTGGTAGVTSQQLQDFADELGNATLTSEDGVLRASRALLSFQNIQGETFFQTLRISQDIAETLGGDIEGRLTQVAKALEDPIRGVTALSDAGTQFTSQQKEQIKALVDAGEAAQAQQFILAELENQYGGTAEAAAQGLVGALDTLGENVEDATEALGGPFLGASTAAVNAASSLIRSFSEAPPALQSLVAGTTAFTAVLAAAIVTVSTFNVASKTAIAQAVIETTTTAANTVAKQANIGATIALATAKNLLAQNTGTATAAQLASNKALAVGALKAGLFAGAAAAVALVADSYLQTTAAARETRAATREVDDALTKLGETAGDTGEALSEALGTEAERNAEAQVESLGKVQGALDAVRSRVFFLATAAEAAATQSSIAFDELATSTSKVGLAAAEVAVDLENGVTVDPDKVTDTINAIDAATAALEAQAPVAQEEIDRRDAQIESLAAYRDRIVDTTAGVAALTDETGGLSDKLKELSGELANSQAQLELLNDSAIAQTEEAFASGEISAEQRQGKLTAIEKSGLENRLTANRDQLARLRELEAAATGENKEEVAAEILEIEQAIATDRIAVAKGISDARIEAAAAAAKAAEESAERAADADAAAAKAAEEAAKRAADAAIAAAEKRADGVEAARKKEAEEAQEAFADTERQVESAEAERQRRAEEAFGDRQRQLEQAFNDEQRDQEEAFTRSQEETKAAFEDTEQADAEAFEQRQQASKKQFEESQRQAAEAFAERQREADKQFSEQQTAAREAAEERFGTRRAEIERELQLDAAETDEEREALEQRFETEDEVAARRAKAFAQLEAEEQAFEEQQQQQAEAFEEQQRIAKAEFEAAEREAKEADEARRQAAIAQFEETREAAREVFEESQREQARAFNLEAESNARTFAEQQRNAERQFKAEQRAEDAAFDDQRRAVERQFKDQQREADLLTARNVASILAAARPAPVEARRKGGPVLPGQAYLVGEDGPELIYPTKAGYVATAAQTAQIFRGQSAIVAPENVSSRGVESRLDSLLKAVQSQRAGTIAAGGNTTNIYEATDPVGTAQKLQLAHLRSLIQSGGY